MSIDEPRDESGYPGFQGLEAIADRKQLREHSKMLESQLDVLMNDIVRFRQLLEEALDWIQHPEISASELEMFGDFLRASEDMIRRYREPNV